MTDKEMTEIIATKVMGWCCHDNVNIIGGFGAECPDCGAYVSHKGCWYFNPLTSDADCMMAWDKFGETRLIQIFNTPQCSKNASRAGTWDACYISDALTGEPCANWCEVVSPDRRRAMVECMAKAVSNG